MSILLLYVASAATPLPFVYTAKQYRSNDLQSAAGQLAPPQSRYGSRSIQPVLKPTNDLHILSPNQIFSLFQIPAAPISNVVSVVSGEVYGGHESRTSHGRVSITNQIPWTTDTKQLERLRTTPSQLLSTD